MLTLAIGGLVTVTPEPATTGRAAPAVGQPRPRFDADAAVRAAAGRTRALVHELSAWGAWLPAVTSRRAAVPTSQTQATRPPGEMRPARARLEVERRLANLGYPTGLADGTYTAATRRAMCAWRETHGLPVGRYRVTLADVSSVLRATARPGTSRADGIYVNKTCQVLYQVRNRAYRFVAAVSTGQVPWYDTPTGTGEVWRKWPGWHGSSIYEGAQMLDAIYFRPDRPGLALHGSISDDLVEPFPASHGCVRVRQAVIARIFAETRVGERVEVYGSF